MKSRACFAFVALAFACARAGAAPAPAAAALDAVVRKAHDAGQFDGVVLVGRDDETIYRRAIGAADRIVQQPHKPGESWRWGTLTQQVTAVLVMQEVEHGRLKLDDTLATALPGFGGAAIGRVTLRQLLTHTSGLANPDDTPADTKGVPAFYRAQGPAAATGSAPRVCADAPKRLPGDRYENNACDYLVLGAILERLDRTSYAQIVAKRIARPAGLRSLAVLRPGAAPGSMADYTAEGVRAPPIDAGRLGAAGALYGSADDLLRFDRALIDDRLVSAATAAAMRQGNPKLGYVALGGSLAYSVKPKHCTAPVALVERQGEIGGVRAANVIAPERRIALVAFSNTARTDWGLAWQGSGLLHDLIDAALCTADAAPSPPAPAPARRGRR